MELTNTYHLDVSVTQAWAVLADLPRVAACLPGAVPAEAGPTGAGLADGRAAGAGPPGIGEGGSAGDGILRLTVDPGGYQVEARMAVADGPAHRVVITAAGTPGLAAIRLAAVLRPWGPGAELSVLTDVTLAGRLAGLGPGVVAAAASRLMGRFAANLERAGAEIPPAPTATAPTASARIVPAPAVPAITVRPASRREPPGRRFVPAAVAAGAAGAAAGLMLVARRLAAARK